MAVQKIASDVMTGVLTLIYRKLSCINDVVIFGDTD